MILQHALKSSVSCYLLSVTSIYLKIILELDIRVAQEAAIEQQKEDYKSPYHF